MCHRAYARCSHLCNDRLRVIVAVAKSRINYIFLVLPSDRPEAESVPSDRPTGDGTSAGRELCIPRDTGSEDEKREREFHEQEERLTEQTYLAGNILLIPGTSSSEHLRLNLQAAALRIPSDVIADLDAIGRAPGTLIAESIPYLCNELPLIWGALAPL